jgi:hypothetical protein
MRKKSGKITLFSHSLTPTLPHSLTPTLPHSLTPTLPHSHTPSLPHSLTPSLPLLPRCRNLKIYKINKIRTKRALKIRQRRVSKKVKGSNNRKKSAKRIGLLHKKIVDKRQSYQWKIANEIVSINIDAIAVENLNVFGMKRRCKPKVDEKTGRF